MGIVEGPLVYTYPFGRPTGAIQLLYDADQITLGQGVILGMHFRQSQVTSSQTHPGYQKNYQVTAYTVAASAATMSPDPAVNAGSSTGTVVFNGPLTLPPINPLTTQPAAFTIHVPFSQPYPFDGSQGNLLLVVETADAFVPPSNYRVDAVNFTFNQATGLSTEIGQTGCVVNGNALSMAVTDSSAIVGGAIDQTFLSSSLGAFPTVLAALSLDAQPTDLTSLGMSTCMLWLAPFEFRLVTEAASGGYPTVSWTLPNAPWIEGISLASQGFGLGASGLLADSVTSNAVATRIGGSTGPTRNMGMSFRGTGSWAMGTNGVFMAVVALEGVFP